MIELHNICRSFGDRHVLKDISFAIQPGRMTGFIGANGSGKTTTMRIIMGVLSADSGEVLIDHELASAKDRSFFGYMPEERGLYKKMSVRDQLIYFARLHGMEKNEASQSVDTLIEKVGLSERAKSPVEELSLGNQQRAQVCAALVHRPQALILDEPFSGLDPIAVQAILNVLKEYASQNIPVLFSSHQLDIVEDLCEDVVILSKGHIAASGSKDELRKSSGETTWEIDLTGDAGWVRNVPQIEVTVLEGGRAQFKASSPTIAQHVLLIATGALPHPTGVSPHDIGQVKRFTDVIPSLTQIFQEAIQ